MTENTVICPRCDVFAKLVADPKEPRFFASILRIENDFRNTFTGASVGYGETFGLIRKDIDPRQAWQLSIRGGLFSQFDMNTSSNNLLNSDYTIGLLWTYRYKNAGLRLRAYHQSSHIGDEFALENPELLETATGFDYEAADLLGAYTWEPFRVYGGMHYLLQREPENIDRWGYQWGIEYRGPVEIVPYGKPIAGMDVKGFEEHHWTPAYSIKAGLTFDNLGETGRSIMLLLEYYDGFIPFGQFYDYDMTAWGMGVYFGF